MAEERYKLERQLGVGGMGEVWLARDTLLDRPVAVKFLQTTDSQVFKDMFLAEARTLARLQHPNITLIYDAVFDETENRFYIMMEYVEGESLAELLKDEAAVLSLETVLHVVMGVLEALIYAHSKGLVHRDIKPENIVIQENEVKLTDFGLATLVSILGDGQGEYVLGTPAYMPPEQIVSEGVDSRADLYALGVTLFEMVTGGYRPFHHKDKHELLRAHVEDPPPSVREYDPTIPLVLDRIITKLLAKHPDDRYQSAEVLLDIFKSIQARQKFSQHYLQLLDPDARPLIARKDALKKIETVWAETQKSNKPQLLVIQGELGIGKTRLIAEFLGNSIIDKNLAAVVGRCNELGVPYTPYAEILATIFDRGLVKPSTIEDQMDRILEHIPSLTSLLNIENNTVEEKPKPSSAGLWQTLSTRVPNTASSDPLQAQWQFFATVLTFLVELGPVVIFLDDAIFLDESSAALTRFLIQQGQLPLLLIAECRDSDKTVAWLDTFASDEMERMTLSPLSSAETKAYLTDFLKGPVSQAVVSMIDKRAKGNPFHIEELSQQLIDLGDFFLNEEGEWRYKPPEETSDLSHELISPFLLNAFTRRLEKLSQKNREVLALAAIIEPGPEFDFEVWLTLLGGESEMTVAQAALEEAKDRRLVRDMGDKRYSFRPVDVSNALVATISASGQLDLHRQIAEILIDKQGDPILIGHHYEQAGLATESARYLEEAGSRAMAANAINQAINCYNRAVELIETPSAYVALGNLYRQRGAWADSVEAYQYVLKMAEKKDDINDQALALNELAFTLWLSDQYREAAQYASAVLKLNDVSKIEYATAQSHLGMISWALGHLREAETWCRKSVDTLIGSGDDIKLAAVYNRLGLVYFSRNKFPEAIKVTNLSLEIRRQLQDYWGEAYCLLSLGKVATQQGYFQEAKTHFSTAERLFEKIGSNDGLMVIYTEKSRVMIAQNQADESLPLLGKAMRLAQDLGKKSAYGLGDIYLLLAQAHLAENYIERAQTSVNKALTLVEAAGNQEYIARSWAILAQIHFTKGEYSPAEELYDKAITLFKQVGNPAGLLRTKLNYARLLADQGQADRAEEFEQEARTQAAKIGLYLPVIIDK